MEVTPIFSQNNLNCTKHKYEKFLQPERVSIATFFGPITFGKVPLLAFKEVDGQLLIAATGSIHSVDPDRIILKKIILTGTPFKIFKRHCVVRDMFFFPDDIKWFKPVELTTKHGRVGHMLESLGTHGYFKAVFDGAVQQSDTVCLNLYKRIFPVWTRGTLGDLIELKQMQI